jgi:hypothetical protein
LSKLSWISDTASRKGLLVRNRRPPILRSRMAMKSTLKKEAVDSDEDVDDDVDEDGDEDSDDNDEDEEDDDGDIEKAPEDKISTKNLFKKTANISTKSSFKGKRNAHGKKERTLILKFSYPCSKLRICLLINL